MHLIRSYSCWLGLYIAYPAFFFPENTAKVTHHTLCDDHNSEAVIFHKVIKV